MRIAPILNYTQMQQKSALSLANTSGVFNLQNEYKKSQTGVSQTGASQANMSQTGVQRYFYPVNILPFTGSQNTPLTDEDYTHAVEYFLDAIEKKGGSASRLINISALDMDKLNGLQKGIEVFDGLTMKEIAFVLNKPIILLNRGCNNCCVHCGFSATPFSNKTLDQMSYEDFKSLIEGAKELENRMGNKVYLYSEMGLFLDSDCIDIELKDKDGNVYDCIDCMRLLGDDIEKVSPLFDTSGWNPKSEKHQKRAEKFVDFVLEHSPEDLEDINISINPYHDLYWRAKEFENEGRIEEAEILKQRYAQRVANMLLTFSPLIKNDYSVNLLTRAIPYDETDTGLDTYAFYDIIKRVLGELERMLEEDLHGEQKYVQNEEELEELEEYYSGFFSAFPPRNLFPWGRAQKLFNCSTGTIEDRAKDFRNMCSYDPRYADNLINPNGALVLSKMDISARTNLALNFANKDNSVKPFATEIEEVQRPLEEKEENPGGFWTLEGLP